MAKVPPPEERARLIAAAGKPLTAAHVHTTTHPPAPPAAAGPSSSKRKASDETAGTSSAAGGGDGDGGKKARPLEPSNTNTSAAPPAAAAVAAAPPNLFPLPDPAHMNVAQRRQAAMNTSRTIHVTGGRGGRAGSGEVTLTLPPGAGVRELKTALRKKFGKVAHQKMGSLMLVDGEGRQTAAAKSEDWVDGVKVACTYTYAQGNVGNLVFGHGGGGFFGRRGGWGLW